jgi:hypothetical protein
LFVDLCLVSKEENDALREAELGSNHQWGDTIGSTLRVRIRMMFQEPLSHGRIPSGTGKVQWCVAIDHTIDICTKLQKRRENLQTRLPI